MTLQCALAGMYPPYQNSVWNPAVLWQPIPTKSRDETLGVAMIDDCNAVKDAWRPIKTDSLPELTGWLQRDSVSGTAHFAQFSFSRCFYGLLCHK